MYQQYLGYLKAYNLKVDKNDFVRYKNYKEIFDMVKQHNKRFAEGNELFEMNLDEFAIDTEIPKIRAGASAPLLAKSTKNYYELSEDAILPGNILSLPENFDWRDEGKVSPIQNQVNNLL